MLDDLNPSQTKAVLHHGKPLLVIAGAGSGKTKTLTHRVSYLINAMNILPSRLFVTTFTNKAAEEMAERLVPMIGHRKSDSLRIGTFHSLCRKILIDLLERNSRHGVFVTPKLLMGGGRFFKMMMVFAQAGLDKKETKAALKQVSWWKNEGVTVEDALKLKGFDAYYAPFYQAYETHMREQDLMDFDDMLFRTYYELIKPENEKFLERVQKRCEHVLVDEGQDLNRIQFLLTRLLAQKNNQVTLVADDWQVLYGFRGAKVKYIKEFMEWFQPELIKLEQNYRSTKLIVNYGNSLIKNNKDQIDKVLFTDNEEGDRAHLFVSFNPDDEAEKVIDKIQEMVTEGGYDLSDCAIIYRTNSQSRAFVDILVRNQIPHKVHSKFGFYDRAEIKDIVAYIRICSNPYQATLDDFGRIINRPTRYLGRGFITKVEDHQIESGQDTFWEAFGDYVENGDAPSNQKRAAADFVAQINSVFLWFTEGGKKQTSELVNEILRVIPYQQWLEGEEEDDDEPDNDRRLNVDSILVGAARFPFVDEFLYFIDSMQNNPNDDEEDVIHLMTIHKAKGLEFPIVFVVGCSDKLLPHYRAEDPEEERRCCYVAVTRAKERLFLSAIHGKYNRLNVTVSPFIAEMGIPIPKLEHRVLGGGFETRLIGASPQMNSLVDEISAAVGEK